MKADGQARFTFPREVRLRRRPEFLRVQEQGHKLTADCLLCLVLPNGRDDGATRLGLTVSSKVGNAVVRNRIRRRLREFYRHERAGLPRGMDLVFIARPSAAEADTARLRRAFDRVTSDLKKRVAR
mgnify:CR=1 FL=1